MCYLGPYSFKKLQCYPSIKPVVCFDPYSFKNYNVNLIVIQLSHFGLYGLKSCNTVRLSIRVTLQLVKRQGPK